MRCLVTGATGYVGGRLVPRLLARGYRVRAMARNPGKLSEVPWHDNAEVVRGDLSVPESLTAAFDGVDVVYYLVHSMGSSSNFAAEERRSAKNVVAAARRVGVRRLVYLSGLHPGGVPALSASGVANRRRRHTAQLRNRNHRAAGRRHHRFRIRVI